MNKIATHVAAAFVGAVAIVVALLGFGQPASIAKQIAHDQQTAADKMFDDLKSLGFDGGVYYAGQDYVVITVRPEADSSKGCGFAAMRAGDGSWNIFNIDRTDFVSMEKPSPQLIRQSRLWTDKCSA